MTLKAFEKKKILRLKRKLRVREHCFGTANKPRISIYRSNRYIYAQAIDDSKGNTIASINSRKINLKNTKEDAIKVAADFAKILLENGIKEALFDRNGYLYHGVVAAFADSLRSNGIVL